MTTAPLHGGELLTAISTRIVGLMREHYGRGPSRAKTYTFDDLLICVLRDEGAIPIEETMLEGGNSEGVLELRRGFQRIMGERYKAEVELLTGRKVVAFLSQAHVDPDLTVELFQLDRPLDEA
ncbi:MAG: Na-translocating system protein MpsC family protein [Thermoleophilaceae bacterium]